MTLNRAKQRVKIEALSHVATAMVLFLMNKYQAVLRVTEIPAISSSHGFCSHFLRKEE